MRISWRYVKYAFVIFVVGGILLFVFQSSRTKTELQTAEVDTGRVENAVTVSGVARATEAVRLRFPETGTVTNILVAKGDTVEAGAPLVTLDTSDLDADRHQAVASLSAALASAAETAAGPRDEVVSNAITAVGVAEKALTRTEQAEAQKVENARRTLYSSDLKMVPTDPDNNDTPPTVGRTYSCTTPGTYTIEIFPSAADSGYSYRVSGLESGTYTAYTVTEGAFGSCGLTLTFDADEHYRRTTWELTVPNTSGGSYTANYNALLLAEENKRVAIAAAQDALEQAIKAASLDTALARPEVVRQQNAAVDEALARIEKIDALKARRVLSAPFTGTITEVTPKVGEVASVSDTVVTMVSSAAFEVIARIPEIDVTKVSVGDPAHLIFDAKDDETLHGDTVFISPLATSIDGVAYFDATIEFKEVPPWMREGLNADVQLISEEKDDATRIPKRFLTHTEGVWRAFVGAGNAPTEQEVVTGIIGTNGYVEVDLTPGTVLVSPTDLGAE